MNYALDDMYEEDVKTATSEEEEDDEDVEDGDESDEEEEDDDMEDEEEIEPPSEPSVYDDLLKKLENSSNVHKEGDEKRYLL